MINSLKRSAEELFGRTNWPNANEEDWRRTDLARLLPRGILDSNASLAAKMPDAKCRASASLQLPDGYAGRIVSENGVMVGCSRFEARTDSGLNLCWVSPDNYPEILEHMCEAELNESAERITAWHYRDMPGALVIEIIGELDKPILIEERLVSRNSGDAREVLCSAPHLHITAASGSRGLIIWSLEGISKHNEFITPIVNGGLSASVSPGARLDITLRQNFGTSTVTFLHGRLEVEEDAGLEFREAHFGSVLLKTHSRVLLKGRGADVRLSGAYLAGRGKHYDIGTIQEHRASHATSNALYKGAVINHAIFQGLINVQPNAAKTDAYLTNNNLILGAGARSDSLPKLNILTNDVKCSHGSTTGRLDNKQIFYLETRGFSRKEATRELVRGFLLKAFNNEPALVREMLERDIDVAIDMNRLWVDG